MSSPRTLLTQLPMPRFVATLAVAATLTLGACNGAATPGATQGSGSQAAGGGNSVAVVDFSFNPATLTLPKGTTVTWTNTGSTTHTVTADDGSFDSGNLPAGQTFSRTFSTAGTFAYHCTIHASMKGTITVTG